MKRVRDEVSADDEELDAAIALSLQQHWVCPFCTLQNGIENRCCAACLHEYGEPINSPGSAHDPAQMELLIATQVERREHQVRRVLTQAPRQPTSHLPFRIQFELEVLLSSHVLHESDLTAPFIDRLESHKAVAVLRCMAIGGGYCDDTCTTFDRWRESASLDRVLESLNGPSEAAAAFLSLEVFRVCVTPTRVVALPVRYERSNRTLRDVHSFTGSTERMCRVTFAADEQLSPVANRPLAREMEARMLSVLSGGLTLCGRQYVFLGYSSSQLKDASCWFFCPDELLSADALRTKMGDFRGLPPRFIKLGASFCNVYYAAIRSPHTSSASIQTPGSLNRSKMCSGSRENCMQHAV